MLDIALLLNVEKKRQLGLGSTIIEQNSVKQMITLRKFNNQNEKRNVIIVTATVNIQVYTGEKKGLLVCILKTEKKNSSDY